MKRTVLEWMGLSGVVSLLSMFVLVGCVEEQFDKQTEHMDATVPTGTRFIHMTKVEKPEEVLVKFRRDYGKSIEQKVRQSKLVGASTKSGISQFDEFLDNYNAVSFERVIPEGKFEKRICESGLNLWYKISFKNAMTPVELKTQLEKIPEISVVELLVPVRLPDSQLNHKNCMPLKQSVVEDPDPVVDDKHFHLQWGYYNDGSLGENSKVGADINLLNAWKRTMGDPSVIVGVVDGFIQYNHPDLKDNMWTNQIEAEGMPGVDDDDNGYVDDIHGYNFVSDIPDGDFYKHGTHVAGTVAAVNNNGIGVCGVAGGSGNGDGVKLMSCGMLSDYISGDISCAARGIIYAADNGAVILQNSWGYYEYVSISDSESLALEIDALKYFIKYAGYDEDGNVVGPMAGGLVVFAAGNSGADAANRPMMPAFYPDFISVGSIGFDYTPAYYTCYGPWVDITAPGGDLLFDPENGGILSTCFGNDPSDYNYEYMQGTSMACPHVSGVAALVLSYAKSKNYTLTNTQLKDIILSSGRNIDEHFKGGKEYPGMPGFPPFELDFNDYKGNMGNGLIDADMALDRVDQLIGIPSDHVVPSPVEDAKVLITDGLGEMLVQWKSTADFNGDPLESYAIYYSLNKLNLEDGKVIFDERTQGPVIVPVDKGSKVGDVMMKRISGFAQNEKYEICIVGIDRWRSASVPKVMSVTNRRKEPGEFLYDLKIKDFDTHSVTLQWNELFDSSSHPFESYEVRYKIAGQKEFNDVINIRASKVENQIMTITIDGLDHYEEYEFKIRAFDGTGVPTDWTPTIKTSLAEKFDLLGFNEGEKLQYWEKKSYRITISDRDYSSVKLSLEENEGWSLHEDGEDYILEFEGPVDTEGESKLFFNVEESKLPKYRIYFYYTVIGNEKPVSGVPLQDLYLEGNNSSAIISLDEHFTDANKEVLDYTLEVDGESVSARIDDENRLIVDRLESGKSVVTVRATDKGGLYVEDRFEVMGRKSTAEMDIYPNPVRDVMNVRFGPDVKGLIRVRVKNYNGSVVLETLETLSPFAPAKIDMKKVKRGNYQVEVEFEGHIFKGNVIKQ